MIRLGQVEARAVGIIGSRQTVIQTGCRSMAAAGMLMKTIETGCAAHAMTNSVIVRLGRAAGASSAIHQAGGTMKAELSLLSEIVTQIGEIVTDTDCHAVGFA